MARDYDSQLLESVVVRRRRLRDALLFGSQRVRRSLEEGLGKVFGGIALATVLCAGCVGWSFIADQREKKSKEKQPTPGTSAPGVPMPTGPLPSSGISPGVSAGTPSSWEVPSVPPPGVPPNVGTSPVLGVSP